MWEGPPSGTTPLTANGTLLPSPACSPRTPQWPAPRHRARECLAQERNGQRLRDPRDPPGQLHVPPSHREGAASREASWLPRLGHTQARGPARPRPSVPPALLPGHQDRALPPALSCSSEQQAISPLGTEHWLAMAHEAVVRRKKRLMPGSQRPTVVPTEPGRASRQQGDEETAIRRKPQTSGSASPHPVAAGHRAVGWRPRRAPPQAGLDRSDREPPRRPAGHSAVGSR